MGETRTAKQQDAARRNGAKSTGPKSDEGKRRSSANAVKHGALARVHRPAGEAEALVVQMQDALIARYEPQGPGELEVVKGLAGDLVRAQRLSKAEGAAVGLARMAIGRSKEDDQLLTEIEMKLRGWRQLRALVEGLRKRRKAGELKGLLGVQEIQKLVSRADAFVGDLTEIQTAIDGADELVKLTTETALPTAMTFEKRLAKVNRLCRSGIRYNEALRMQIVAVEEERVRCETDLAEIPDDKTVRRLDRYRSSIEKSMLRRIEILKGLRDLRSPMDPME